jgi:alpha-glucosidase (family GH31 glycosyl hydrolase)
VAAPLDRMPLFVREGAIIPMGPVVQHTGQAPLEDVMLLVYPGERPAGASRFELYEDDGRTNAWRRGAHALTELRCGSDSGRTVIEIGEPRGDSSVIPSKRAYELQVRLAKVSRVEVETRGERREVPRAPRPRASGWWTARGFVFVRLPERAAKVTLLP